MIKNVQNFLIMLFDDKPTKEHETYELVNNEWERWSNGEGSQ